MCVGRSVATLHPTLFRLWTRSADSIACSSLAMSPHRATWLTQRLVRTPRPIEVFRRRWSSLDVPVEFSSEHSFQWHVVRVHGWKPELVAQRVSECIDRFAWSSLIRNVVCPLRRRLKYVRGRIVSVDEPALGRHILVEMVTSRPAYSLLYKYQTLRKKMRDVDPRERQRMYEELNAAAALVGGIDQIVCVISHEQAERVMKGEIFMPWNPVSFHERKR